jgi:alanine dehydrogenase
MSMRIGVPTESKAQEHRVGLTPASVRELCSHGHEMLVQRGAGAGIGQDDATYLAAGATLIDEAEAVFSAADLIVKVKEPQPHEVGWLREGQVLFTYLHLAAAPALAEDLCKRGVVAIAYETVTGPGGRLPLLAPMSEVAGRMAIQVGAHWLEQPRGGRGVLLGGVPGVAPAEVVILGAGTVGTNALQAAAGLGARVTVLARNLDRLRAIDAAFGSRVTTRYSDQSSIEECVARADLLIGAVLVPGAAAPRLVTRSMVAGMKPGAVIVDVAIDQGGCVETSRPTTHAEPTYAADGVIHYAVTNMPGAVPHTSAAALNHATLPFVAALADKGWRRALADDPHLAAGLNLAQGRIAHAALAASLGR